MTQPLNVAKYTPALQQWVDEVIQGQRWEHYDDLHVDVLDTQFQRPGRWIEASLLLLEALEQGIVPSDYQILLVIRLATSPVSLAGHHFARHTLEEAVGATPPSFYLFPQLSAVVAQTLQAATQLPSLSHQRQWPVYFQEQYDEGEYAPSLFLCATGQGRTIG